MPRACGGGVGTEGEGAGPNQRSLCVQLRNLDLVLGETAPPESFQRGKGHVFSKHCSACRMKHGLEEAEYRSICMYPSIFSASLRVPKE